MKGRRGKFSRPDRKENRPGGGTSRRAAVKPSGAPSRSPAAHAKVRPGAVVEGTVSANRAGYGFLRVEGFKESVFLPPPEMRGVMHGDRVRVKVSRDATDRWSGVVQEVVGRGVSA